MKYKNYRYLTCVVILVITLVIPVQILPFKAYGQITADHVSPGGGGDKTTHSQHHPQAGGGGSGNNGGGSGHKKHKSGASNSNGGSSSDTTTSSDSSTSSKGGITQLIACIKDQAGNTNGQISKNDLDNCYVSVYGFETTASPNNNTQSLSPNNNTQSLSKGFG